MNRLLTLVLCALVQLTGLSFASDIQLPQSGQTIIYSATDDGDIRAGKPWPNVRFNDNFVNRHAKMTHF